MEIHIDNYPVADLPSRFNLGKQQVYNRFLALGIKPTKVGKRSYITAIELLSLDRLHRHIIEGGLIADFDAPPQMPDLETSLLDTIDKSSRLVENNLEVVVNLIAGAVSQTISSTVRSPLWYMAELEQAQAQGWMLTTAEIEQLIGVKPKTNKGSSTYQRGNFVFTKAGRIGSQTAWQVSKT